MCWRLIRLEGRSRQLSVFLHRDERRLQQHPNETYPSAPYAKKRGGGMEMERRLLGRWLYCRGESSHVNLSGVNCEMGRGSGRGICERNRLMRVTQDSLRGAFCWP